MLHDLMNLIVQSISSLGYFGIFVLMFIESSFFPLPSEIVMIPAGYLVYKGEMNMFIVILMGTLGSLGGALFNYFLALKLGRKLLEKYGEKYGKYFLMKEDTIPKIEKYFDSHGHISTFVGRLIPGLRHYISLPAGLAKMNLVEFSVYTTLGAFIWVTILTLLGYYIGANEELIKLYLHRILAITFILLAVIVWIYYKKQNKQKD